MDFLKSLFGDPANDPKLNTDNMQALLQYLKQPTANDRLMAVSKALSDFGAARARGGDIGMALGAAGQGLQGTIGQGREGRMNELQTQMALKKLWQKPVPTRRETTLSRGGKYWKGYEDVNPETGEAVLREDTLIPIKDQSAVNITNPSLPTSAIQNYEYRQKLIKSGASPEEIARYDAIVKARDESGLNYEYEKSFNTKRGAAAGEAEGAKEATVRNAPTALDLLGDLKIAIAQAPKSGIGADYERTAGYFGLGDEAQQGALAKMDTIGGQLMAYANKLPGPASDADRLDFKASVGVLSNPNANMAQRNAAADQAISAYQRLIKKYGEGKSYGIEAPKPAGVLRYNPATGMLE